MKRFFFDILGDGEADIDDLGFELAGASDARAEALRLLPDIFASLPSDEPRSLVAIVRDEGGRSIFQATLTLAGDWVAEGH